MPWEKRIAKSTFCDKANEIGRDLSQSSSKLLKIYPLDVSSLDELILNTVCLLRFKNVFILYLWVF